MLLSRHSSSQPLIPHGLSVVITAPAVFQFTAPACPDRHMEAVALLGGNVDNLKQEDAGTVGLYTSTDMDADARPYPTEGGWPMARRTLHSSHAVTYIPTLSPLVLRGLARTPKQTLQVGSEVRDQCQQQKQSPIAFSGLPLLRHNCHPVFQCNATPRSEKRIRVTSKVIYSQSFPPHDYPLRALSLISIPILLLPLASVRFKGRTKSWPNRGRRGGGGEYSYFLSDSPLHPLHHKLRI